jgi:hypothetical protein
MLINGSTSMGLKPTGGFHDIKVLNAIQTISTFYL